MTQPDHEDAAHRERVRHFNYMAALWPRITPDSPLYKFFKDGMDGSPAPDVDLSAAYGTWQAGVRHAEVALERRRKDAREMDDAGLIALHQSLDPEIYDSLVQVLSDEIERRNLDI